MQTKGSEHGTTERVTVRVLLLFGDQAEIVAADIPPEERAEPERYPGTEIAAAVGVPVSDLPGTRMTADVGDDGQLPGWQLA
ncbi:hypothetical protein ABZ636_39905 [Streptomyces sp. NPDC007251]|uniref:hypothetical protein n=1 Tax=unclassified Streptomyces TaxID=2593676 RepID=UPI0033C42410